MEGFFVGWPKAPSYRDAKKPELLCHEGVFVRMTPPPALFRLGQQSYILADSPTFVVKRQKLARNALRTGTFQAYVEGTGEGLGEGMGSFTAKKLVIVPTGRVSRTLPYRKTLED